MSVSPYSDEPGSDLEDDDDPLFPFGPMPTEPLIARDRSQAFRFLSYGKGTRCVVTEDYEMMLAVGTTQDLKGYVAGWFRAHGSMCRVGISQSPTPGWSQMILALEDGFHDEQDDRHDVDVDLDMGFLDAVDYLVEDDGEGDDDEDMLEALDLDPDYLPGFDPPMSEDDLELDDDESDEELREHCENCGSESHNLDGCDGPTDAGGYLTGCPLCNTTSHDLDACAELDGPRDHRLVDRLYTALILHRSCRAPFRSEKMPWTKALRIGQAWGFTDRGPFPWSAEMAIRMKGEIEADPVGYEQYEEEDPVTQSVEAVEVAIRERRVPDPGDISDWMPPANAHSPVL
ncbi:hypothetical protein VUR80DRAFT_4773 [Thermomyces stellatus]